jgi:hypothetical protein
MNMRLHIVMWLVAGIVVPVSARADHHAAMSSEDDGHSSLSAGVSVVAATFSPSQADQMFYAGDYEGVVPAVSWAMDRYAATASWAYYWLERNGQRYTGIGDAVAHGQVALIVGGDVHAGAMLSASMPTGAEVAGLGMGHPMVMPALWATWRLQRVQLSGSFGYSWAIGAGDHVHGMEPLVEPMNMSELTWSGGADVGLGAGVGVGARLSGGVPVGAMSGQDRMIGAARATWGSHRVETAAELQAGLAGDPFNLRAVFSTALRF